MILKIGCHEVRVVYKEKEEMTDCLGLCSSNEHIIYIRKGMPQSKEKEVLLHECLHALDEFYGIGLGEKKIGTLAICLLSLLTENKVFNEPRKTTRATRENQGRKTSLPKHHLASA